MSAPAESASQLSLARRDYQTFRRLLIALLVIASVGPLSLNLADPDLWGHVRYGEEWIATGELPRTATHTFTAEGHPWINHENLAEWLMAHGFRALGVQGMLAAKVVLGMAILLMMSIAARRAGVRPVAAWACLLLVAHNLHAFFPIRPQLLSFLWCAVMLLALERAWPAWGSRHSDFRNTRRASDLPLIDWRWLVPMPLLFAIWANSHGGFVAGFAIFTAILTGRVIELVLRIGRAGLPMALRLGAVLVASGMATLLNPYGLGLHVWLLDSLGQARPEITEWLAPAPGNPVFLPFATLLVAAVGSLIFSERRRDPAKVIVLLLVGWQAVSHLRHIAFFALLCGFWLPPHLQSVASRLRQQASENLPIASLTPALRSCLGAGLALGIALQAVFLGQRIADLPVPRPHYPVDAIQWMADHRVEGDLVVNFNWAQYAIAALAPDVRVAFDGRFRTCYPQSVIDRHFDFILGDLGPRNRSPESGPIDGHATLRVDNPDYVLVDRKYQHAVGVMRQALAEDQSPWTLIYEDAIASLYARKSVVDDPESPRFVPADRRFLSEHASLTSVTWPALPRRRAPIDHAQSPREVAVLPAGPPNEG